MTSSRPGDERSNDDDAIAQPHARGGARVTRIVVTGSESTGKTTLAAALAETLGTLWVPEYARTFAEQAQRVLTVDDVAPIALGQMRREDDALADWEARFASHENPPPLVLDTDLVSTTVYAEHYYGSCPEWIMEAARERRGDLYLLCSPDLPWVADGVRDRAAARASLDAAFRARLREFGAATREVSLSGAQRLEGALQAIRRWVR